MTINERIRRVIEFSPYPTTRQFAIKLGFPATTIDKVTKNGDPRADTLIKILRGVPQISPAWLLCEEGPMLRDGSNPVSKEESPIFNSVNGPNFADMSNDEMFKTLLKTNAELSEHIKVLTSLLDRFAEK